MTTIIAWLVRRGIGASAAPFFAWGGAALLAGLLAWGALSVVKGFFVRGEVIAEQGRTIEVLNKTGAANENASAARLEDTVEIGREHGELDDAIKNTNDPDAARRERGCIVRRQQAARGGPPVPAACGGR
jgi:hypothetical protein